MPLSDLVLKREMTLLLQYLDKIASVRFSSAAFILLRLFTQSKPTITVTNAMKMSRRPTVTPAAIEAEVVVGTGAAVAIVVGTVKQKHTGEFALCVHHMTTLLSDTNIMLCISPEFLYVI